MYFSIISLSIIIALIGYSWITQLFMHNKSYIDEKRLTPYASISLLAAAICVRDIMPMWLWRIVVPRDTW